MSKPLITEIEEFMALAGIGEHRFGMLAARNGRLVERIRSGKRVWPETEKKVRDFIRTERRKRPTPSSQEERVA